jgi:hypothetical protein
MVAPTAIPLTVIESVTPFNVSIFTWTWPCPMCGTADSGR